MKQHSPLDPATGIENAALPWTNGNPGTGTDGSFPPFGLFVDPQSEILNAQRAGGLADSADGSDTTQLGQSISRGTWLGTLAQPLTANDLTGALPGSIIWPALLAGMEFSGVISAPNTGPMTVTLTGFGLLPGKLNLTSRAAAPLVAGDVPANTPFKFRFDGTRFRISGSVASDTGSTAATFLAANSGGVAYTTPGSFTFIVPDNIFKIFCRVWGGGAGGGGSGASGAVAGGGGAGGYAEGSYQVSPRQQIPVIVGARGTAGLGSPSPSGGGNGGTSSVGSLLSATGGSGGGGQAGAGVYPSSSPGGIGSGGQFNAQSGAGAVGFNLSGPGIAGGGVGGAAQFGGPPPTQALNAAGQGGYSPGAGGQGGVNGFAGGLGGAGQVNITY
ncbi:hypothetical protein ABIE45_004524 [Methylobacterium sp. OAE515]|uniref:glycine-rich domain-containing protein n=1 Tax=Methylobacterium sp. OAE515 TaxID=2817895 RepID=UPI00178AADD2